MRIVSTIFRLDFVGSGSVVFFVFHFNTYHKIKLENIEGAIKNGQSRETGNIEYTRRRKTKQKHNLKTM